MKLTDKEIASLANILRKAAASLRRMKIPAPYGGGLLMDARRLDALAVELETTQPTKDFAATIIEGRAAQKFFSRSASDLLARISKKLRSNEVPPLCPQLGSSETDAEKSLGNPPQLKRSSRRSNSTQTKKKPVSLNPIRLSDITVGGRIRKSYQAAVWKIARHAASRVSNSIQGNMISSQHISELSFLDGGVHERRGIFGPSSGMFWDGLLVKAYILYELGLDASAILHRQIPEHKQLRQLLKKSKMADKK